MKILSWILVAFLGLTTLSFLIAGFTGQGFLPFFVSLAITAACATPLIRPLGKGVVGQTTLRPKTGASDEEIYTNCFLVNTGIVKAEGGRAYLCSCCLRFLLLALH